MKKLIRQKPVLILSHLQYRNDDYILDLCQKTKPFYFVGPYETFHIYKHVFKNGNHHISVTEYLNLFNNNKLQYVCAYCNIDDNRSIQNIFEKIKSRIKYKKTKIIIQYYNWIDLNPHPHRIYIYDKNTYIKVHCNKIYQVLFERNSKLYEIYHTILYIQQLYRRYLFLFEFYSVY